jgi:multidrug efflux pump subunit AcrB
MLASYLLARTLVPTLASLILPSEVRAEEHQRKVGPNLFTRMHHRVEHGLDRMMEGQRRILEMFLKRKTLILLPLALVLGVGVFAAWQCGREFFPKTDAGLLRLFLRVPSGIRVEDTARVLADVQREIRQIIPSSELQFIVENIGAPNPINLAWAESAAVSSSDAEIFVQLHGEHGPSGEYEAQIRAMLAEKFPDVQAFFQPADATSQTLSSGAPTTFEVRIAGRDRGGNLALARELRERFAKIPGAVDVTLREVLDQPGYALRVDRVRAATFGLTQQDASRTLLATLGTGGTVSPNYWADPATGSSYDVQVIAPPTTLDSLDDILNLTVRSAAGAGEGIPLRAFATVVEKRSPASISRTMMQPTFTVVGNAYGRDLGAITVDLEKVITELRAKLKPGNRIELAGQAALMRTSYAELIGGLGLAAVLVFLVMVVNFQSWTLPFVAISGLPIAISGAVFGLWVTGTPISVPALMGVIMVVGVSTANSVLVTSFARYRTDEGESARDAALESATTRLRPVLMTALAMILGVIPMAIGHAEGGEQNAPLGRAVIGGLLFGTTATLFFVPIVFAAVRGRFDPRRKDARKSEPPKPANLVPQLT